MSHDPPPILQIGVDVGGTFTDLVATDGQVVRVIKVPSTPPDFENGVLGAVRRCLAATPAAASGAALRIVHGSTVATNALLERHVEPTAFITTEGFADMLLIGRQNRPQLYALRPVRPEPLATESLWFTVRERVDSKGHVVIPLDDADTRQVVDRICNAGVRHVAVCLLFSFIEPSHERRVGEICRQAGLTVSLSCDVLPEFREYERASATVINACLRPRVESYLNRLEQGLNATAPGSGIDDAAGDLPPLTIMSSTGGTLSVADAVTSAARLVLSGPAGGVIGAAAISRSLGLANVITYDMGGTSTDVATIVDGQPLWTTQSVVDGFPIGLPTLDIHTVGAGGGSVAYRDAGGAIRVGPRSAGARPGPACYGRGGVEPTVTDANLLLGRLAADRFAGSQIRLDEAAALRAVETLGHSLGLTREAAAEGIVRLAEENMSRAVRAVTSRRGLEPRDFTLMSFGGAGGLHACRVAESLDVRRIVVPPFCGVLSALGMIVAPPLADASKTVLHLGEGLDDHRLYAEYGHLNMLASERLPASALAAVEAFADLRFAGQSYELTIRARGADRAALEAAFREQYLQRYGVIPGDRPIEIVTLRLRRIGKVSAFEFPLMTTLAADPATRRERLASGGDHTDRGRLFADGPRSGPFLLLDDQATTFIAPGWQARCDERGVVTLER